MLTDKIKQYYIGRAKKYGSSGVATMGDMNIRELEVEKLIEGFHLLSYFKTSKILEVGCGNGYVTERIAKELDVKLTCIDFCEELIEIAKRRKLKGANFSVGNALNLEYADASFDFVFTERCLINIPSWERQQQALREIWRVLKVGGGFLMIEAFTDGLNNLNKARADVGLEPIKQPYWDLFFDKNEFKEFIKGKFVNASSLDFEGEVSTNFLSSYYFGSRVIYPAFMSMMKRDVVYNTKFVEFFRYVLPYGNYAPVQIFILEKI